MAITRTDVDEVFGPDGRVLSSKPVVRDVTTDTNRQTIEQQAAQALDTNRAFLALASPNNAQTLAQVRALTRQNQGVIRLLLGQLDDTN